MKRARGWQGVVSRMVLLILMTGLTIVACGGPVDSGSPSPAAVNPAASVAPSSLEPSPSATGFALPTPSSSVAEPTASVAVATATPRSSGRDAPAAACTGSADTRAFFTRFAEAVSWSVYCAVLPRGWYVEAGEYRLANGGRMVISYRTRAGGHFELREGRWCTGAASACSPHDSVIGDAAFGDLDGQLETLGGDLVLYVDPGEPTSWSATGTGMDDATFRVLCAAVRLVKA